MKLTSIIAVIISGFASYSLATPTPHSAESLSYSNATSADIGARDPQAVSPLGTIGIALDMAGLVVDIVKGIQSAVKEDNTNRETFTTGVVAEGRRRWPEYNFVVCHVEHASQWDGIRGQDWDHRHEEVDIVIGGTIGYEIYYARSGIFKRIGDGGYINWAFSGNVQETSFDGKTLRFASPV